MNALRVYVAAPYEDAHKVRDLHERLRVIGVSPTSQWADDAATDIDDLEGIARARGVEAVQKIAKVNDEDVSSSHVVLALPRKGAGAEMFCEIRWALVCNIHVLYVGRERECLSRWRRGVTRVDSLEEALQMVAKLALDFRKRDRQVVRS